MIDHEEILRQGVEAYNRRDLDGVLAVYDPEIEMQTLLSGTARGHDGMRELVQRQWEEFDSTLELSDIETLNDGRVLAGVRFTAQAGGMEQRQELGWLVSLRAGKLLRIDVHPNLDEARRAAGGRALR